MNKSDERLLQLDMDNLCSGLHDLRIQQNRIEAKVDAVLEGLRQMGLAQEEAGGKLLDVQSDLRDRLEEIRQRGEEGDD